LGKDIVQEKELIDFFPKRHSEARALKTYTVFGKYSLITLPVDG
jgi:hypothetical protein